MKEQTPTRGELLTLDLVSWGRLGEAMADYEGRPVFVFGGIPGERVVAQVLRVHRKYVSARVTQVLEPSPDRVEPPCPYFGVCTGCQWQHVGYSRQLAVKREKVVDALERVGGFHDPPVASVAPSSHEYGYRNHARFTIGPGGILGFVNRETGEFISHLESIYQNVFDYIDPQTGAVRYREDIASAGIGDWVSVCPSTAGGHNWPSMSYSPEVNALIVPLSQSCLEIQGRPMAVNGKVEILPMMYLALSYDHRIIDGREAVTFLVRVKDCIEDPQRIMLDI